MKFIERIKEKHQFKVAYRTASYDERREMIQEYIIQNSEDRFIRSMERKYKGWLEL